MTNTITIKASALEKGDLIVDWEGTEHKVRAVSGWAGVPLAESSTVYVWVEDEAVFIPFGKFADVQVRKIAPEAPAKAYAPSHGGYPGTVVPA